MKSPQQLAEGLARQWQRADWRERQLLPAPGSEAWPLRLVIGLPDTTTFLEHSTALRQHWQPWQTVASGATRTVVWEARRYRGGSAAVPPR